jgi:hypothetical protein
MFNLSEIFFLLYIIKNMGGGLMQLVAYGAQDVYLTGNPQITFFKVVYRRHTNFAMESIEQTMTGSQSSSGKSTVTISRNGDLVGRVYLQNKSSGAAADASIENQGYNIIDNVVCEIGGQQIDKQYGHWMEVWAELTEPNEVGHIAAAANLGEILPVTAGTASEDDHLATGTRFQRMSGAGGVAAGTLNNNTYHIPLHFWFCRNPGLALPLIALQYHEVKLIISFNAAKHATQQTVSTWSDYIYLDTDERRRFAQVSHEYLIEQVQHSSFSASKTHDLTFNHPVKELIWTGARDAGTFTPATLSGDFNLKLNGHDRMYARDYTYFTRCQVHAYHTGFGGVSERDSIGVYSFALKPEEHQPSGTCNFSRIDNAQLVTSTGLAHEVYAVNYNVLRVMSGMGGLAYSN